MTSLNALGTPTWMWCLATEASGSSQCWQVICHPLWTLAWVLPEQECSCSTSPRGHHQEGLGECWGGELYPRGILKAFDFFPTLAIYSSFHANGLLWSMNALGKGKRCIKSAKAHSYKWVGRFTTFSPESNLSAISHRVRDRLIWALA